MFDCSIDELREEKIQQLKKQAEQNDAFLNGDGYLYDHDFIYTNDKLLPKKNRETLKFPVFLLQMFVSLSVFFLYLCYFYEILPVHEKIEKIIEYFLPAIN